MWGLLLIIEKPEIEIPEVKFKKSSHISMFR